MRAVFLAVVVLLAAAPYAAAQPCPDSAFCAGAWAFLGRSCAPEGFAPICSDGTCACACNANRDCTLPQRCVGGVCAVPGSTAAPTATATPTATRTAVPTATATRSGPNPCKANLIAGTSLELHPPSARDRAGSFTWKGTWNGALPDGGDPTRHEVRVIVFDSKGAALADHTAKSLRRLDLTRSKDQKGYAFLVEGPLSAWPAGLDAKTLTPGASLIVDWSGDIAGPCGAVKIPVCKDQSIAGESFILCR